VEKIAAFDIGSNAVRLAIAELDVHGTLAVTKKMRVPLRLGSEVFQKHAFSPYTITYASKVFANLRKILDHEQVSEFRAVATSAYRNAVNSQELGREVMMQSGIEIRTIDGDLEAKLIREAIQTQINLNGKSWLLVDIGGGSTEISILNKGKVVDSKSFAIGTVRLLEIGRGAEDPMEEIQAYLKKMQKDIRSFFNGYDQELHHIRMIGTGGNFRRLLKLRKKILSKKQLDFTLSHEVPLILKELEKTPFLKRMKKFSLRPDRADVIIPALHVILTILQEVEVKKIYSPDIGLVHGVLMDMVRGRFHQIKDLTH
jgi:exopolyphosphatase/guanosine-5'-triphosphate,3'-diphosphate pyrophosphatase